MLSRVERPEIMLPVTRVAPRNRRVVVALVADTLTRCERVIMAGDARFVRIGAACAARIPQRAFLAVAEIEKLAVLVAGRLL